MRKKHEARKKHEELITAWLNGAQIQWRFPTKEHPKWWDFEDDDGIWRIDIEYRIKPEEQPVVRWQWTYQDKSQDGWYVHYFYLTEEEALDYFGSNGFTYIKLEFTRQEFPE